MTQSNGSRYGTAGPFPDEARLLRRVRAADVKVHSGTGALVLGNDGMPICASNAFQNETGQEAFSVFVAEILDSQGLSFDEALEGKTEMGLVVIAAKLDRDQGREIELASKEDSRAGGAHAHVTGPTLGSTAARKVRQAFAANCVWVRLPPSVQQKWEAQTSQL